MGTAKRDRPKNKIKSYGLAEIKNRGTQCHKKKYSRKEKHKNESIS